MSSNPDTLPQNQISPNYRYPIFHRRSKTQTPSKEFALTKNDITTNSMP
jgi:hypothetical protein